MSSLSEAKRIAMEEMTTHSAELDMYGLHKQMNDQCFVRCVPKPGASLSPSEQACTAQCATKYLDAWFTIARHGHGQSQKQ